ncbi:hypothetical protein KJ840_04760 [Patescibacteria group bacterium]|nr:hypothetical protein [Patescibacteria group bacterium]
MTKEQLPSLIGKLLLIVLVVVLLISSMVYLNKRWSRIRDIRRQADAKAVVRALQLYYNQYDEFPDSLDDDGFGWDKSNDLADRSFLKPLVTFGLLNGEPFDPENDADFYYRYQKFPAGSFGCQYPFVVFQVMQFETNGFEAGQGQCEDIDFTALAPYGYTWQEFE